MGVVDSGRRDRKQERGLPKSERGECRQAHVSAPVPLSLPSQPQQSSPFEFACRTLPLPNCLALVPFKKKKKKKTCTVSHSSMCVWSLSPAPKKTNKVCRSPVSDCAVPTGHRAFLSRPVVALYSHARHLTDVSTKELVETHAATLATTADPKEMATRWDAGTLFTFAAGEKSRLLKKNSQRSVFSFSPLFCSINRALIVRVVLLVPVLVSYRTFGTSALLDTASYTGPEL